MAHYIDQSHIEQSPETVNLQNPTDGEENTTGQLTTTVPEQSGDRPHRYRKLTEKGTDHFIQERSNFYEKIDRAWSEVEEKIANINQCADTIDALQQSLEALRQSNGYFQKLSRNFMTFLIRTGTEESKKESSVHREVEENYSQQVQLMITQTETRIQTLMETRSQRSSVSKATSKTKRTDRSRASSITSSMLARKSAEAQAARARAQYAEKERELEMRKCRLEAEAKKVAVDKALEQAEIDANLKLLQQQKEAAAVEAEVHALQSLNGSHSEGSQHAVGDIDLPRDDPMQRTEIYVESHASSFVSAYCEPEPPNRIVSQNTHGSNVYTSAQRQPSANYTPAAGINVTAHSTPAQNATFTIHNSSDRQHQFTMPNNDIPTAPYRAPFSETPAMSELTKYMLRKELVMSRLVTFNDKSENYKSWKYTFTDVTRDLNVSPQEELDLLVKWLGPSSSKHALSIRAASISNPILGLQKVWERLDKRYGCPETIEKALRDKITNFPKITNRDNSKLWELADILSELESAKDDPTLQGLCYYDTSCGINPIVEKLPYSLQEKWTTAAAKYKKRHNVSFPPFRFFTEFIRDIADTRNDPSFNYSTNCQRENLTHKRGPQGTPVVVKKTDVSNSPPSQQAKEKADSPDKRCPLHNTKHALNECKGFKAKPLTERKNFLKEKGICFRCCTSTKHVSRNCKATIKCAECDSDRHPSGLHVSQNDNNAPSSSPPTPGHGAKKVDEKVSQDTTGSLCTEVCGEGLGGKSCSKICKVKVYHKGDPGNIIAAYAILDDQSNRSLAKSDLFEHLNVKGEISPYTLQTCAGRTETAGRRAHGFVIEANDSSTTIDLPTLIECNEIPNNRHEIPTPDAALHHPHLQSIADSIPPLDSEAQILLLLGRDALQAHHVHDQRIGPCNTPYAQKLSLGWVIIGETCINRVHMPGSVAVYKTSILDNGRPSLFEPCPNYFSVKERISAEHQQEQVPPAIHETDVGLHESDHLGASVFVKTKDDDKIGLSIEDKEFLEVMDKEFQKNEDNSWISPLPFRPNRPRLPNNRELAAARAKLLDRSLKRSPSKREHFVQFMKRIFDNDHAELAPELKEGEECWYLPIFGVYHPKKPDQIRAVFDSSAQYKGVSLNNVLLTGPDLTNNLLGVLIRFRKEQIAITADIQQMFHCFLVREDHRNFLRFLWYRDNDPEKDIIEYRMKVHVFGNSPSPAVATYGLRKTAQVGEKDYGSDVREFIERDFYVDDGLKSLPTSEQAVDLLKRTQQALHECGNLRLHKIASNSAAVMEAFPPDDHAKDLKNLDLGVDTPPTQRSLGLSWDVKKDTFTFGISTTEKAYTRRGILSTINSLYDPLGLVSPVTIQGKFLLRDLTLTTKDWDEPLPLDRQQEWEEWRNSLTHLQSLQIPRTYARMSLSQAKRKEIHVFTDASEKAISAVAYIKVTDDKGRPHLGFIFGKAKLAPVHGHTIPRLELCAAVLGVEMAELIADELHIETDIVRFYTDSKVVLGYINNQTRRFYTYVTNRVQRIRRSTKPEQWSYVRTDQNPADHGTRGVSAPCLENTSWLSGPEFLLRDDYSISDNTFTLVNPDHDTEIRPQVTTLGTKVSQENQLGSHRFTRFSSWKTLVKTIANLKHIARVYHSTSHSDVGNCRGWHLCSNSSNVQSYKDAERYLIKQVQQEAYSKEKECIMAGKPIPNNSALYNLDPKMDKNGMFRVGGRLSKAGDLSEAERNPVIIPGHHHVSTLIIRHFHNQVKHQGRHFTEGAVRAAGFWLTGAKRRISSIIHSCVTCRKLRGRQEQQKMADLPEDRLTVAPPFTYVGVDAFGPWRVTTRRTRGGQANGKRWAILFTCMTTRAVHIEVIEDMSSSCFINALRRFVAIRGPVEQWRSDRGTNFVGSSHDLGINTVNVEDGPIKDFLYEKGSTWVFNPPHSSHMGGTWERMIGIARRILDSMMLEMKHKTLTHEVLTTFMAEVCAIINARPIVPVPSDPQSPFILSPAMLLTQKTNSVVALPGSFDLRDLYKAQWRQVQALANQFWSRWRREFLQTLQNRRKWQKDMPDLRKGDIVLLKDKDTPRNNWPVAIVTNALPGSDGRVRKAEIRTVIKGKTTTYTRPITEMILLLSQ